RSLAQGSGTTPKPGQADGAGGDPGRGTVAYPLGGGPPTPSDSSPLALPTGTGLLATPLREAGRDRAGPLRTVHRPPVGYAAAAVARRRLRSGSPRSGGRARAPP